MSIKNVQREIPARKETYTESVTCDLCKTVFKQASHQCDEGINWTGNIYDEIKTQVYSSKGYGCSDGGYCKGRGYHVCPKCFDEKLEPFLKSFDAEATIYRHDW